MFYLQNSIGGFEITRLLQNNQPKQVLNRWQSLKVDGWSDRIILGVRYKSRMMGESTIVR